MSVNGVKFISYLCALITEVKLFTYILCVGSRVFQDNMP